MPNETNLCACGCGAAVRGRFVRGHNAPKRLCGCGCGQLPPTNAHRRRLKYAPGHKRTVPSERACVTCGDVYPRETFRHGGKLRSECLDCYRVSNAARQNPELMYRASARSKYNLTDEELDRILDVKQCAICGGVAQHIDHNHRTGQVRGRLCRACNHGLGNFKDNPELLMMAVAYLSAYSEEKEPVNG